MVGGETLRADDGLALSSRNGYLSADERAEAVQLITTMRAVRQSLLDARQSGGLSASAVSTQEQSAQTKLDQRGWKTDYVLVRRQRDLLPATEAELNSGEPLVILAASRLGKTRLIDNLEV